MNSKRKRRIGLDIDLDKEIRRHGLIKESRDFQIDMEVDSFIQAFNKQVAPFLPLNIVKDIVISAMEEGTVMYEKDGVTRFKVMESNIRNYENNINNFCAIILGKTLKHVSEEYHSHVVERLAILTSIILEPISLELQHV